MTTENKNPIVPIVVYGKTIPMQLGMEATIGYGCDYHPAKVVSFRETGAYLYIELVEYHYTATAEGRAEGPGHQDWEIQWDKPLQGVIHAKVRKSNGKYVGERSFVTLTLGNARVNFCWEF